MFGFVCLLLYAAMLLPLQFVYVFALFMHCAHAAHICYVYGANPQKGDRTIDRVRVNSW